MMRKLARWSPGMVAGFLALVVHLSVTRAAYAPTAENQ